MNEFGDLQLFLGDEDHLLSDISWDFDFDSSNINNDADKEKYSSTSTSTVTKTQVSSASSQLENVSIASSSNTKTPIDQSRFPEVPIDVIEEMKANSMNKNTKRTTQTWMTVVEKWCHSRNLNTKIETLPPPELDKLLERFYAEIKKQNGDDYEPESLRVMQASIERYLKEKNYPRSIIRAREFHNSQETLNAVATTLRKQGKGKRPNKSKPINHKKEEELWKSGELGSHNGRALTQTNFKILTSS